MNYTPRKILAFRTPQEVFDQIKLDQIAVVALLALVGPLTALGMACPNFSHGSCEQAQTKRTHDSAGPAIEELAIARVRGLKAELVPTSLHLWCP